MATSGITPRAGGAAPPAAAGEWAPSGTGEPRDEDHAQGTHMKLFSPERANALICKLEPLIEELLTRRRELAIKLLESDPALHHAKPASRPRLAGMRSACGVTSRSISVGS